MVTWARDGYVSGYTPTGGGGVNSDTYRLASSGSVDANGITRLHHHQTPASNAFMENILLSIALKFDPAMDPTSGQPYVGATCVLAPDSLFSSVPTPQQIMNAPTWTGQAQWFRMGTPVTASTMNTTSQGDLFPGRLSIDIMTPNTKYWVLVFPARYADPNAANGPQSDSPIGDPNINGRAISVWTNRAPAAPTITSPSALTSQPDGGTFTLSWTDGDPDDAAGGTPDEAGVEIQYAPVPTSSNPNPTWQWMEGLAAGGSGPWPSWLIVNSDQNWGVWTTDSAPNGLRADTRSITVKCGQPPEAASQLHLPPGNWQIRVRTYDFGFPNNQYPAGVSGRNSLTPGSYPTANQSPWSQPVTVKVQAVCPPPFVLAPINNTAIPQTTTNHPYAKVTLSWKYLNGANPPNQQAQASVRMRRVGDSAWTYLLNNANFALTSWIVNAPPGFDFVSGNQYEWQVNVTDSAGNVSGWSQSGFFWITARAQSGAVLSPPSATIAGSSLGCGHNRAFIYRRGGKVRVAELTGITHVDWNRVRDDISVANVTVEDWSFDCGKLLSQLEPWMYELVIFRDNGYGSERVWEGPITQLDYDVDKVSIQAKDVVGYLFRRIVKTAFDDTVNGMTAVKRATQVILDAFAPDDPNVLAYLTSIQFSTDVMEYRAIPAWSKTAYEEVDDMAANAGLDYTVVGRSIILWDSANLLGKIPTLRDSDLGQAPKVSIYGMFFANVYAITDGSGNKGLATALNSANQDPNYGIVEVLSTAWSSTLAQTTGSLNGATQQKLQAALDAQATRGLAERNPPPVVITLPPNATLNPDAPISISWLVPGIGVPVQTVSTLMQVAQMQKLDSVKVTEDNGKETVSITLTPFGNAAVILGKDA